jgi:hypothetical protein
MTSRYPPKKRPATWSACRRESPRRPGRELDEIPQHRRHCRLRPLRRHRRRHVRFPTAGHLMSWAKFATKTRAGGTARGRPDRRRGPANRPPGPTPASPWPWSAACCWICSPPATAANHRGIRAIPRPRTGHRGASPGIGRTPAATTLIMHTRPAGHATPAPAVASPARCVVPAEPGSRPDPIVLCRRPPQTSPSTGSAKSAPGNPRVSAPSYAR